MKKTIALILSGCGVFDGSEIHESVAALYHLSLAGFTVKCYAPDKSQMHVLNHCSGDEMQETRNVLIESARIARGDIQPLQNLISDNPDGIFIPGGFGAAKNLSDWAIKGAEAGIDETLKTVILHMLRLGKPIAAICMAPTLISLACAGTEFRPVLTVGTSQSESPYPIQAIHTGMESLGAGTVEVNVPEVCVDDTLKCITAPCYMMETDVVGVFANVAAVVSAMRSFV
jgi:enhancing lycopene biosynthesis protein 2